MQSNDDYDGFEPSWPISQMHDEPTGWRSLILPAIAAWCAVWALVYAWSTP